MSDNPHSPEDWRQVNKGRRAVTHTDERRVTPVRNQFQELSDHQEDPTPRLAPREPIVALSRLPPPTDPPDSSNSNDDDNDNSKGDDNTEDDNAKTGSIESIEIMSPNKTHSSSTARTHSATAESL
jgi:hypothetical protein